MSKYTFTDEIRLILLKKQILENSEIEFLSKLTDDELLSLLNLMVLPNSVDTKALQYTILFNLIFQENQYKRERVLKQIRKIISLTGELPKTEKTIIKFGLIQGFLSTNYRKEMFRYIKIPVGLRSNGGGRKIITSYKFKEVFYFAYNLIKRGKKNDRLPKL